MRMEQFTRPARLLRVREQTDPADKRSDAKKPGSGKSRFVAPSYFSAEQQDAMARILETAQVGDAEGRQLFLTALEYDLGAFEFSGDEQPAPKPQARPKRVKTPAQLELQALGEGAKELAARLARLPEPARDGLGRLLGESDPLGRRYEERFFVQLEWALEHLAAACGDRASHQEPEPAPLNPRIQRLIRQVARIYQECLEVRLMDEALAPFMEILGFIRLAADLDIPCEKEIVVGLLAETK